MPEPPSARGEAKQPGLVSSRLGRKPLLKHRKIFLLDATEVLLGVCYSNNVADGFSGAILDYLIIL